MTQYYDSAICIQGKLHRSHWDTPNEYIRLTLEPTSEEECNSFIHIEKGDKRGVWFPWQPTSEDLMACDWKLLQSDNHKPEDCMLVFELELGAGKFNYGQEWGYMSESGKWLSGGTVTFGSLNPISNKTTIPNVLAFYWSTYNWFYLIVSSDKDDYRKIVELLTKDLYVTVDNTIYSLGTMPLLGDTDGRYTISYGNYEAQKLGGILKQTGEKKTFCLNWRDK
ncbi:Thoeris anti-defense Tad2 family protein [Xenorhabdus koppenhoeferi]|uniref:DUF2829 domain-containing protein n=1 Tax=Xenorhabdus koppenhoeferi TaxID=351659 RepID=A0A1I7JHR6_9GAMM|nr:MW1434 family type I TA system toxin [Xenorhabdus koppenhoeferi]SFU84682.1 Protein of unknown function [Xenorhabdus koppenhoeferi]